MEANAAPRHVADFHTLRKTFDTNLQRNGIPPRVVMELMGHGDIRLTMKTYTDASRLRTHEAIKTLPSFNIQNPGLQLGPQEMVATGHKESQRVTATGGEVAGNPTGGQ